MRVRFVAISALGHVVGIALVAAVHSGPVEPPREQPLTIDIELVSPQPQSPRSELTQRASGASQSAPRRRGSNPSRTTRHSPHYARASEALSGIAVEESGGDSGDGGGGGGRGGGGRGDGGGLGAAAPMQADTTIALPKPIERVSKARPAKLIYPTREREADAGELFIANVTVDDEGNVVGARNIRGSGPRANDASSLIFRFRYLPALDDEGRAIASTFDQRFVVSR